MPWLTYEHGEQPTTAPIQDDHLDQPGKSKISESRRGMFWYDIQKRGLPVVFKLEMKEK